MRDFPAPRPLNFETKTVRGEVFCISHLRLINETKHGPIDDRMYIGRLNSCSPNLSCWSPVSRRPHIYFQLPTHFLLSLSLLRFSVCRLLTTSDRVECFDSGRSGLYLSRRCHSVLPHSGPLFTSGPILQILIQSNIGP